MPAGSAPPARARNWRPYLVTAACFWVLPLVALLIGYLTAADYNESGQCTGIGFGCTLTPKDTVVFLAMFGYPLVFVAGLVVMAVIAGIRAYRGRNR